MVACRPSKDHEQCIFVIAYSKATWVVMDNVKLASMTTLKCSMAEDKLIKLCLLPVNWCRMGELH